MDVLALRTNLPIYLSMSGMEFREDEGSIKRIVAIAEWREAFQLGRKYSIERPVLSRALSWYRKGLIGENPIGKLMSFWSVLESISSKYHRRTERTRGKSITQICDCFDQLWGSLDRWHIIPNNADKVNEFSTLKNGIAHGAIRVDVEQIRDLIEQLPLYQNLAYAFLVDWERDGRQFEVEVQDDLETTPEIEF